MSLDKLRLKLDGAIKKNDPDLLEKVIAECVGSGHPELMPDIQEARLHLESLEESSGGLSPAILLFIPYIRLVLYDGGHRLIHIFSQLFTWLILGLNHNLISECTNLFVSILVEKM